MRCQLPHMLNRDRAVVTWVALHMMHDDVMKWKHFPRHWPFVLGIHRSPVNSPHKGQWRGALMFSLICVWINGWVKNREAGDLRRHRAHYDVIVIVWTDSLLHVPLSQLRGINTQDRGIQRPQFIVSFAQSNSTIEIILLIFRAAHNF